MFSFCQKSFPGTNTRKNQEFFHVFSLKKQVGFPFSRFFPVFLSAGEKKAVLQGEALHLHHAHAAG